MFEEESFALPGSGLRSWFLPPAEEMFNAGLSPFMAQADMEADMEAFARKAAEAADEDAARSLNLTLGFASSEELQDEALAVMAEELRARELAELAEAEDWLEQAWTVEAHLEALARSQDHEAQVAAALALGLSLAFEDQRFRPAREWRPRTETPGRHPHNQVPGEMSTPVRSKRPLVRMESVGEDPNVDVEHKSLRLVQQSKRTRLLRKTRSDDMDRYGSHAEASKATSSATMVECLEQAS